MLGREIVLRKTMLDECTGDRFEEVLAVFSTAVLRKFVLAHNYDHGTVARTLATADWVSLEEEKFMLPLALAHRSSITALLRKKQTLRSRYEHFAQTLDLKSKEIAGREEQLEVASENQLCQQNIEAAESHVLVSQVRENWLGEARWTEVICKGKSQHRKDSVLDSSFTATIDHVRSGSLSLIEGHQDKGLLDDLETKITKQRERLKRWVQFREDLNTINCSRGSRDSAKDAEKSEVKGAIISFKDHSHLTLGSTTSALGKDLRTSEGDASRPLATEYGSFTARLQEELINVTNSKPRGGRGWRDAQVNNNMIFGNKVVSPSNATPSDVAVAVEPDLISGTETLDVALKDVDTRQGRDEQQSASQTKANALRPNLRTFDENEPDGTRIEAVKSKNPTTDALAQELMAAPNDTFPSKVQLSATIQKRTRDIRISTLEPENQERLAEAIVSSVVEATPSPAKSNYSLVERTRMSMAFSSSHNMHQTMMMGPPPPPSPPAEDPIKAASHTEQVGFDSGSTLVERTRRSMSMLPASSRKIRKSIYQPRSSKVYPTNQFETPKKQGDRRDTQDDKDSTPKEELFSQQADYASVFKSRPKIALSPTISPSMGLEGLSELEEDTIHAGNDSSWGSSPLTRVR